MQTTVAERGTLDALVADIRSAVQSDTEPALVAARVAEALAPRLGDAALLAGEQIVPDPERYRQHILHVEPDGSFSVVALVWLPGQATPIHDHVSWCVVGVHQGEEHEVVYRLVEDGGESWLEQTGATVNPLASVAALVPPGDIHHVANHGAGVAISLHVYGADIGRLGSSIRRRYDQPVREAPARA